MRKTVSIIFFLFLLIGLFYASVKIDRVVKFEDFQVEMEVRRLIDNYSKPIYQSQLLGIYELNLSKKGVSNIEGIENIRNLEVLHLGNNNVQDVSSLRTLSKLRYLNLQNNGIKDLGATGFDQINQLKLIELYLDNDEIQSRIGDRNRISNIELLKHFDYLEVLSLGGNQVNNISALTKLNKLTILDLSANNIQNITQLSTVTTLKELDLSRNNITNIYPLAMLNQLRKLNLRNNNISDITVLRSLENLEYLNIHSNNNIQSIEALANLKNLKVLIMRNVPVGDNVSVLKELTSLTRLNVRGCLISDFSVLGVLMAAGALQDNPDSGLEASVNIRDNILYSGDEDPLDPIRPYWDNIANPEPLILPHMAGKLALPKFSQPGGYYKEPLQLTLSVENPSLEIYYTLDGSDPKPHQSKLADSPYQKSISYTIPININNRANDENVFASINTTHVENVIEWKPPINPVYKATTVRAMTYDPVKDINSPIVTHTYFVDENIYDRYKTLPVISLTADYDVLFDPEYGILNTGSKGDPFDHKETRVPANIEFFEPDGSLGFGGLFEIKLHGFTSVANPQKGFHVYAESWLGEESIKYPIFKDSVSKANEISEFSRFIIRAWGTAQNWDVFFSDAYHQTLMADSDLDIQGYRPAILFINGEYWGLYELREANKDSSYYHQHYFDGEKISLDILEMGTVDYIEAGNPVHWHALMDFVKDNDLSDEENYAYVTTQMDIDNFTQYIIHCIFTGKKDWPGHNEAMWRPQIDGAKWRWIQFDMDQGLRPDVDSLYDMVNHVTSEEALQHPLLIKLMKNETYKNLFLNTFADMLNTTFLTSVEVKHFNQMSAELEPYLPEFDARWQMGLNWEKSKHLALELIENRWVFRKNQVLENFNLISTNEIKLISDQDMGYIRINNIKIVEDTPGVINPEIWSGIYFSEIPITVSAIPKPGYRFVGWETSNQIHLLSAELTLVLTDDITLEAKFEPMQK